MHGEITTIFLIRDPPEGLTIRRFFFQSRWRLPHVQNAHARNPHTSSLPLCALRAVHPRLCTAGYLVPDAVTPLLG